MLKALEESGLSVAAFAGAEGFDTQRLYFWKRRLDRAGSNTSVPTFVEVRPSTAQEHVEVVLRSGQVLRVCTSYAGTASRIAIYARPPYSSLANRAVRWGAARAGTRVRRDSVKKDRRTLPYAQCRQTMKARTNERLGRIAPPVVRFGVWVVERAPKLFRFRVQGEGQPKRLRQQRAFSQQRRAEADRFGVVGIGRLRDEHVLAFDGDVEPFGVAVEDDMIERRPSLPRERVLP